MSTRDILAGKGYIEIGAKMGALDNALKKIDQKFSNMAAKIGSFGAKIAGFGAAITGPIALSIKSFAAEGDAIAKMARRTDLAVDKLSVLAHSAALNGTAMESVEKAVIAMNRGMFDAMRGVGPLKDSLETLGLTAEDFVGKSTFERFEMLSKAISKIEDPGIRSAVALKVFGKAGHQLLPMIEANKNGMADVSAEARRLGLVWTKETAASAEETTDQIFRMERSFDAIKNTIAASVAPMVNRLANVFLETAGNVRLFIEQNKEMVITIAQVGGYLVAAGGALLGVAAAFKVVAIGASLVSGFLSALPIIATVAGLAALATAAVLAYDAIAEFFGGSSTGFTDFVGNIRVGGLAIRTWLVLGWASVLEAFEVFKFNFLTGWNYVTTAISKAGISIMSFFAPALIKAVEMAAPFVQMYVKMLAGIANAAIWVANKLGLVSDSAAKNYKKTIDYLEDMTNRDISATAQAKIKGLKEFRDNAEGMKQAEDREFREYVKTKRAEGRAKIEAIRQIADDALANDHKIKEPEIIKKGKEKIEEWVKKFKGIGAKAVAAGEVNAAKVNFDPGTFKPGQFEAPEMAATKKDIGQPREYLTGTFSGRGASALAPLAKIQKKGNDLLSRIELNTREAGAVLA